MLLAFFAGTKAQNDAPQLEYVVELRVKCEGVVFNLEMQMFPTGSEAERALYYACASIHQQQLKGKNYDELEAVHQVFLMAGSRKSVRCPDGHYQLLNIENGESLTDKMKISMINLERVVEEIDDFPFLVNDQTQGDRLDTSG